MTFTCNCKKKVKYADGTTSYCIGDAEQKTGWTFVPLVGGGTNKWLCPKCAKKAKTLTKELIDIIGTDEFIPYGLKDDN